MRVVLLRLEAGVGDHVEEAPFQLVLFLEQAPGAVHALVALGKGSCLSGLAGPALLDSRLDKAGAVEFVAEAAEAEGLGKVAGRRRKDGAAEPPRGEGGKMGGLEKSHEKLLEVDLATGPASVVRCGQVCGQSGAAVQKCHFTILSFFACLQDRAKILGRRGSRGCQEGIFSDLCGGG